MPTYDSQDPASKQEVMDEVKETTDLLIDILYHGTMDELADFLRQSSEFAAAQGNIEKSILVAALSSCIMTMRFSMEQPEQPVTPVIQPAKQVMN